MQAAIAAGVKRIVLSEFSTNIETELSRKLPIVKDKMEIRKYVEEITKDGKIEWSSVNNGPFFVPWLLLSGWLGPNPKTGTALYRMFNIPFFWHIVQDFGSENSHRKFTLT